MARQGRPRTKVWIATVLVESSGLSGIKPERTRIAQMSAILSQLAERTRGHGVVVCPAGWFSQHARVTRATYERIARKLRPALGHFQSGANVVVVTGIDGGVYGVGRGRGARDQTFIAVGKRGLLAAGRKFHPTNAREEARLRAAPDHLAGDAGLPRMFKVGGRLFYTTVCFDIFGLRHEELSNPGCNAILSPIHQFKSGVSGGSGVGYYVRYGWAGAAREWDVPVFSSVQFLGRPIAENMPSGVAWTSGNLPLVRWKYRNNPVAPTEVFRVSISGGLAEVRLFRL